MTDLDTALRTMLQTRAQDITDVPAHLERFDTGGADGGSAPADITPWAPRPRQHRAGWLIAACVAVVIALVAVLVVTGRDGGHRPVRPATTVPAPSSTSVSQSPSPTATHIASRVSLSWFGMADLPGYTAHARESLPGYQWLALRGKSDTGVPVGCNGCESASVYVYVFAAGHFRPAKDGVSGGRNVSVGGTKAVLGTAPWYGASRYRVPSVAWQFRPGEWVLVQGVTPEGGTQQSLLTVADAVRPTQSVPIGLPCTFGYLPALPVVDITDDRSESYAFSVTFGDVNSRDFSVTLWTGTGWPYYDRTGMSRATIGGRPGYYGPQQGAGVLYHGGGMAFSFGETDGATLTATDDRETRQVMAGIRWANGDGRAPAVPARQAFP